MSEIITLFNHFPELQATMPLMINKALRKAAVDVAARAKISAPKITGFMANSIYITAKDYDTYGQRVVGNGQLLPPVAQPESWTTVIVAVGAAYGIYVEMGSRYVPARPYLIPALEYVKPKLEQYLAESARFWALAGGAI